MLPERKQWIQMRRTGAKRLAKIQIKFPWITELEGEIWSHWWCPIVFQGQFSRRLMKAASSESQILLPSSLLGWKEHLDWSGQVDALWLKHVERKSKLIGNWLNYYLNVFIEPKSWQYLNLMFIFNSRIILDPTLILEYMLS